MSVFYCLGTLCYLNRSFGNEARILSENPFSVSDEHENELPSTEESQTQRFDIFYLFFQFTSFMKVLLILILIEFQRVGAFSRNL